MSLHPSTFEYLKPTELQLDVMSKARNCFKSLAYDLDGLLPEGPDKTYILRKIREIAMWANVSITRQPDGTPRQD